VAILVFWVQYVNQKERRHGELISLKVALLTQFGVIQQRIVTCELRVETLRIATRSLPNYEELNQQCLDMLSTVSETMKENKAQLHSFDTKKNNKSSMLINYQSMTYRLNSIANDLDDLEGIILKTHTKVMQVTK
jgi:hypothetical protein